MDPTAAPSAEDAPHRSGTSPVHAPEFRADEPTSFDRRLTPVVAASWPEQEAATTRLAALPAEPAAAGATDSISARPIHAPAAPIVETQGEKGAQEAGAPAVEANEPTAQVAPGATSTRPLQDLAAAPTSQRSVSISLTPSGGENAFWDGEPQYSVPPARLVTDPPRPAPSTARLALTRSLFVATVGLVVGLLYYEASIAYHVPWREPQQLLHRIRR